MKKNSPTVSVVLNVYNESRNIEKCLGYIRGQKFDQKQIEIILVDDKSTDDTVVRAKKFDVQVVTSGFRNRERAKSIGLSHVSGTYVLLMDADVYLHDKLWIQKAVSCLEEQPRALAVQNTRWKYKRHDNLANRYCNLFGVNDPFVIFLGKRGALMASENSWPYKDTIISQHKNYDVVKFTPKNLPTMGAQGFLIKMSAVKQATWKPYFFHLDAMHELVSKKKNVFIVAPLGIEHRYVNSLFQFHKKLFRNIFLFLDLQQYRTYTYDMSFKNMLVACLFMMTVVVPLSQSVKGYMKVKDPAWFLHPIICFTVPILYSAAVIIWKLKNLQSR